MIKQPRSLKDDRPQDRKRVLRRLGGYLLQHKALLLLALALTLASNLLALLGPLLSGRAIDAIGTAPGGVDFERVWLYVGLMLGLTLLSSVLTYLLSLLMIRLSQRVIGQMRRDVFGRMLDLPVGFFDRHPSGELVSRISYDIDTVNASLSSDVLQAAASAIMVLGSLGMMLYLSPLLVLVFLVTIPISLLLTRYMTRKVRPLFRKRSEKLGALNGFVEEKLTGQKTIQAYHQEANVLADFDRGNTEAVDAYYSADYYGSMVGPSVNLINNLSLALVSVFGAVLFLLGRLSLGNLSSFVLYSRRFSGPINEMANILSELQSAFAAAERVFALIDEPTEPADAPGAVELRCVKGEVTLRDVSFAYAPGKPVIQNLSLTARPGSLVAIVGPTGAGKTTLINLLMRFYDLDEGAIRIDGHDIRKVTRASLRRAFAMVLQDTWLFHGTVYDNIAYANPKATQAQVEAACKAARIHDYIRTLPKGYHTLLSEEGLNISQGQKQLMTIARAMLLDAPMLILDEATSNVDTRTERHIQQAMEGLMQGRTSFVIAHRLSTIEHADTILVVQGGQIVEQGDHQALLDLGGLYAQLYRSQFA